MENGGVLGACSAEVLRVRYPHMVQNACFSPKAATAQIGCFGPGMPREMDGFREGRARREWKETCTYLESSVGCRTASLTTWTWDACRRSRFLLHRPDKVNISHSHNRTSSFCSGFHCHEDSNRTRPRLAFGRKPVFFVGYAW